MERSRGAEGGSIAGSRQGFLAKTSILGILCSDQALAPHGQEPLTIAAEPSVGESIMTPFALNVILSPLITQHTVYAGPRLPVYTLSRGIISGQPPRP